MRRADRKAPSIEESPMARAPNYNFERQERERLKAIKLREKAAAKAEAREAKKQAAENPDTTSND